MLVTTEMTQVRFSDFQYSNLLQDMEKYFQHASLTMFSAICSRCPTILSADYIQSSNPEGLWSIIIYPKHYTPCIYPSNMIIYLIYLWHPIFIAMIMNYPWDQWQIQAVNIPLRPESYTLSMERYLNEPYIRCVCT
jgi:hypothetical protein